MTMKIYLLWQAIFFMLLISCTGAISAKTVTDNDFSSTAPVSLATLKARIEELEVASDLDDESRNRLVELYRKSLRYLEERQSNNSTADKFVQARKTAPKLTKINRDKLAEKKKNTSEIRLKVSLKTPFTVVQQHLFIEKANLAAVEAKLADLELQMAFMVNRTSSILQQLNAAKQEQGKIFASLETLVTEGQPAILIEAQRWKLQTQALALRSNIRMLDQELLSQPMRSDFLDAQSDRQEYSVENLTKKVKLLNEMVSTLRKKEAEKTLLDAEKAQLNVADKHPVIQFLATENARLSEEIKILTAKLDEEISAENEIKKREKNIADEYVSTRKKLEIAGLSNALGQMLLEQRLLLPDTGKLEREAGKREDMISATALNGIRHKEELRKLKNKEDYIDALGTRLQKGDAQLDQKDLYDLMNSRRDLLEKIIDLDDAYFRILGEQGFIYRKLLATVVEYNDFLVGNLLWVRSSSFPNKQRILSVPGQIKELIIPEQWKITGTRIRSQVLHSSTVLLLMIIPVLLLWKAKQFRHQLQKLCKSKYKFSEGRMVDTLKAIGITFLLAAPWPLLLAIVGWEIHQTLDATNLSRAIAAGTLWIAPSLFYLRVIYVLCKTNGVAEVHFGWPKSFLSLFRKQLKWLMIVFLPIAFVTSFVINNEITTMGGGLGRILTILAQLILALFFYRLFDKNKGALQVLFDHYPAHAISRFRYLWYSLTVILMLLLAALTFSGYVYTSAILTNLLLDSLTLVLIIIMVQQLGVRWLLLAHHKLIRQTASENFQAERAKEAEQASDGDQENDHLLEIDEPNIDLYALSQDSRKLLDATLVVITLIGLGWLWSEVVPGFKFLENITLWYQTSMSSGQEESLPVTLADLGLAIVIAIIAFIAAKRLPALLEIILLQLSTPAGSRYTITTLTNYAIVSIGIVSFFKVLGVGWAQVQWLIAALGVGIGFGLQEIVANFICGIIILFERPIRVGDVVTVGDTDGVVTRIQIRATTIRNWDKKELLVPNKEFVTGRLLNWSLSDQVTRLIVSVGVAYGSDIQKAKALMLEVAEATDCIMVDPKPSVTFESFADNALTLVLRCFVESLDNRLTIISSLHEEINRKFNDADINIAFPQRDVHIDTQKPLDIHVHYPDIQQAKPAGSG